MSAFVDMHRDQFGVEPICQTLGVSASAYGIMAPAVFAAGLPHRLPPPPATASGERGERRCLLLTAGGAPQPAAFPASQGQSPAADITSTSPHPNRHSSYRDIPIATTQISQQVDR